MEIARLITIEEAAQRLGIQPRTLIRYVRSGKIKAKLFRFETMTLIEVRATQDTNGRTMAEAEADEAISISEASRRYGVPQPLLSRWVKWGLIRLLGREGKEYRISAGDVRRLAEIYHEVRAQEGGFKGRSIRRILRKRGLLQD
jgi:predicted site-specific integrase-resolvase